MMNPDKIGPSRPAMANMPNVEGLRCRTPKYVSGPGRNNSQEKVKAMRK